MEKIKVKGSKCGFFILYWGKKGLTGKQKEISKEHALVNIFFD